MFEALVYAAAAAGAYSGLLSIVMLFTGANGVVARVRDVELAGGYVILGAAMIVGLL